jgi:RNase H-like domain found in reverse transcriptase
MEHICAILFFWTEECRNALQKLKGIVTLEPVLVPPRQEDQFILEVDASQYTTGAILYQADPELKDRKGNPLL